jgi:hypothetical protein
MCRLLAITAAEPVDLSGHLRDFARMAQASREHQGDGWGCAWLEDGSWRTHHSLSPIWEEPLEGFGRARVLIAHARSAFREEGISVENNMPFVDAPLAFAFNGELRGVRIAETGRIGAEKLFRFLVRHGAHAGEGAARTAVRLVRQRTRYVRAMNFVLGGRGRFVTCCSFGEDADYFTLHARREAGVVTVCSAPHQPGAWEALPNGAIEVIPWFS